MPQARNRRGQVLFIDARKLGRMADRTHKELTDDAIAASQIEPINAWAREHEVVYVAAPEI